MFRRILIKKIPGTEVVDFNKSIVSCQIHSLRTELELTEHKVNTETPVMHSVCLRMS
jgi:hypothetical protein